MPPALVSSHILRIKQYDMLQYWYHFGYLYTFAVTFLTRLNAILCDLYANCFGIFIRTQALSHCEKEMCAHHDDYCLLAL